MLRLLSRAGRILSRTDVAAALAACLLAVLCLASCFPQVSPAVAADPVRLSRWERAVRDAYGDRTDALAGLGMFRVGRSPLLLVPLGITLLSLVVCTTRRLLAVWRSAVGSPATCSDADFASEPLVTKVNDEGDASALLTIVRERLRRRGFAVCVEREGPSIYVRGDRNRLAQLGTLVTHLALPAMLAGILLSSTQAWRQEVTVGPGEAVPIAWRSLSLRNDGFDVERHPDGRDAGYKARLALLDSQGVVAWAGAITDDRTGRLRDMALYVQGYWGNPGSYNVVVQLVRDPGYLPFAGGAILALVGIAAALYFPHCYVRARIGPEGTLRLAGWAGRHLCGFERQFSALGRELRDAAAQNVREAREPGSKGGAP